LKAEQPDLIGRGWPLSLPEGLSQEVIKPAGNRLLPETIRYRETYAHKRRLERATQWEIANELGISQAAVSKILRRIDRRILRQMEADVQLVKVRQSRRLNDLYEEALYGWRESLGVEWKDTSRSGERAEKVESSRTRSGDPRFLAAALAVLESERRLWGLSGNAPAAPSVQVNMVAGMRIDGAPSPQPLPQTEPVAERNGLCDSRPPMPAVQPLCDRGEPSGKPAGERPSGGAKRGA
jgi:Mn-dependent DtxR family transcriptional regulator